MRKRILQMILDADGFISGTEIAEKLEISRVAIWKHINILKEQGYQIESVNKKGYRIVKMPTDVLYKENIQYNLKTKFIGKEIHHFETINSTNDYAKQIADNSEEGTVIISEEQTSGRGRVGKQWKSNKGEGIWMSVILKPNIVPYEASFLTLVAGASIVNAMQKVGIDAKIKWPNDIIINNKKICGILTELSAEIERINYVVVGIGMNVKTMEFDEEIANIATSMHKEGYKIERTIITKLILEEFERLYIEYVEKNNKNKIMDICRNYSAIIGKDIYILEKDKKTKVKCIHIDDDGNLMVEQDNKTRKIISGEVSIRGEKGYV